MNALSHVEEEKGLTSEPKKFLLLMEAIDVWARAHPKNPVTLKNAQVV